MGISTGISNKFPRVHSWIYTLISILFLSSKNSNWHKIKLRELKESRNFNRRFLILGSGTSINDLSNSFWEWANKNTTSIAVGNWHYHEFVPDIYCSEFENNQINNYRNWLLAINKKKIEYNKTLFLPKASDKFLCQNIANEVGMTKLHSSFEYPTWFKAPSGSEETFRYFCSRIYRIMKKIGLNYIPSIRSNIIYSIFLAKELGAQEIILAGVDGYGGYFYNKYLSKEEYEEISKTYELNRKIQRGSDPNHGIPTIPQILKSMNRYIIPIKYIGKSILKDYLVEFKEYQNE